MWRWQHVPRRAREAPAARRLASGGDAGQRGSRRRDDDCAGGPIPGAESGDHEVRSTPLSPPFFHVSERTACPRVPRAAWRCSARASGLRLSAERGLHDFPNRLVYRAVHVRGRAGARPDQAHAAWKHVRFHFTALRSDSPVAAGAMAVGETNAQDAADGTSAHERKPARGHGSAPPPTVGPGSDESIFEYHERLPCVQSDPRRRRWRRAPICFETRRK